MVGPIHIKETSACLDGSGVVKFLGEMGLATKISPSLLFGHSKTSEMKPLAIKNSSMLFHFTAKILLQKSELN